MLLTSVMICLLAILEVTRMASSGVVTPIKAPPESADPDLFPVNQGVRKRPTGIVGLNLLLEGGFPEGTLIMIHGTAVAGMELAARQFCNDYPDEAGMYVVYEDLMEEEGADAKMNPALLLDLMKGKRVVVDSLSDIVERYGIEQALFILSQVKEDLRENNANLMFIVYSDVHSPMEMTRIMRAADIVIEFKTEIHQAEISRTLAVQKIKGGAVPRRLLPFIITDNGIEASTTSRVV